MFSLLVLSQLMGAPHLYNTWTVESHHPKTALEQFQEFRLGGLVRDKDYFFVPGPRRSLQKRLVQTGEVQFEVELKGDSQAAWTIHEGFIYGGDAKGNLYSVDTKTGQIRWTVSTKGIFVSAPEIRGDKLWIMNSLGTLQCYDLSSGQWLWQQTDPSIGSLMLLSSRGPLWIQNQIVAGFPSALIQSFDPESGSLLWKESFQILPGGADSFNDLRSVSGKENLLFASSFSGDLKVWELNSQQRKVLWSKKLSLYAPVTFDTDGTLYLSARDGSVRALDSTNGLEKWKFEVARGLASQPILTHRGIWVSTTEGELLVIGREGKLIARSNSHESAIWNEPLVVNESEVITMTARGILRRMRLSDS